MKIQLDTTEASGCTHKGCYNPPPYYRHHLGNDSALGGFSRQISRNYYHYTNCAKVCDKCHMTVHFLYYQELPFNLWKDWTPKGVLRLKRAFIRLGKRWLAGDVPSPSVPNYFRAKWQESKLIFEATLVSKRMPKKPPLQSKSKIPTFTHE